MRRLLAVVIAVAVVLAAALAVQRSGSGSTAYRVDAIFDNARGLVAGQLVKVAGARVGTIDGVRLTSGYEARVQMSVDHRFAPFRADASCAIRPEGLIAENYVECDPGALDQPPLARDRSAVPTVAVSRDSEPVSLTDLFNIFDTPTRDRLAVTLSELGISTAGRGTDINAIIRRANPALTLTRRAIALIEGQRVQVRTLIDASDRLIAGLAARPGSVRHFITASAAAGSAIAAHRDPLSQAVARLPGFLSQGRGALTRLDAVATAGTPLVDALRASAPAVRRVSADLPALARAAPAATHSLGRALTLGAVAARRMTPVARELAHYARSSLPDALLNGRLYANLRDAGFVENLLALFYYGAAATARFDSTSHILPSHVLLGNCAVYATAPVGGCGANYAPRRSPRTPRSPGPVLDYLLGR